MLNLEGPLDSLPRFLARKGLCGFVELCVTLAIMPPMLSVGYQKS